MCKYDTGSLLFKSLKTAAQHLCRLVMPHLIDGIWTGSGPHVTWSTSFRRSQGNGRQAKKAGCVLPGLCWIYPDPGTPAAPSQPCRKKLQRDVVLEGLFSFTAWETVEGASSEPTWIYGQVSLLPFLLLCFLSKGRKKKSFSKSF